MKSLPNHNPEEKRIRISLTRTIPKPHAYIQALLGEFKDFAYSEEGAPTRRGRWRSEVFRVAQDRPLDLEVGTGNGNHFSHRACRYPDRMLVGLELKYKPLIQSIRRALEGGAKNMRMCRFHAHDIDQLFAPEELNDIFVHFPDPWERPKKFKNRIMSEEFLMLAHKLQRPGASLEFKTDSRDYFLWAMERIKRSPYQVVEMSLDVHQNLPAEYFITTFEKIFIKQNIPINRVVLIKSA